jgi:hypothetical protein
MEMPTVMDPQGQIRDWAWLSVGFGPIRLERAVAAEAGQRVYRLVEVRVVEGPAAQLVGVSDQEDKPLEGVLVVRSWPGAPELPAWSPPASRWLDRGVSGPTGRDGIVGFGLGPEDSYALPDAGPGCVWVEGPVGPSDRISGLGRLGTPTQPHLDLFFRLEEAEESALPETVPDLALAQAASAAVAPPLPPPPPPVPLPLTGDQWQLLMGRLDQIIEALEERVKD